MKLTPKERQQRIYALMEENPEFIRMKEAYDPAKVWFDRFTAWLPRPLRDRLRSYPGMMFFMHRRIMDTVCRHMKFQDEE